MNALRDRLDEERRKLDERASKLHIDEIRLEETRKHLDIVR
ncbi:unnamed protein product [Protopolystoma xenopodis]|uniref:Uncharacterized protein n=1 Tax=Protopolystoma xenopodis TaxID=117903 RepID=A0A448WS47_9PLAT|nr:unnamed protein product [Protopolystoma xenopodis]